MLDAFPKIVYDFISKKRLSKGIPFDSRSLSYRSPRISRRRRKKVDSLRASH